MNITKVLPSRLESLPGLIKEIMDLMNQELSMSEEDEFHIKLALEEALTNAVMHGNKQDPDLSVRISINAKENQLIFEIRDQGAGFDFNNVPDPTSDDKIMKTSGRGVYLLRKLMDDVKYSSGGRELRMVKILGKNKRKNKMGGGL